MTKKKWTCGENIPQPQGQPCAWPESTEAIACNLGLWQMLQRMQVVREALVTLEESARQLLEATPIPAAPAVPANPHLNPYLNALIRRSQDLFNLFPPKRVGDNDSVSMNDVATTYFKFHAKGCPYTNVDEFLTKLGSLSSSVTARTNVVEIATQVMNGCIALESALDSSAARLAESHTKWDKGAEYNTAVRKYVDSLTQILERK